MDFAGSLPRLLPADRSARLSNRAPAGSVSHQITGVSVRLAASLRQPLGFPAKTSYGIAALMELAGVHASGEVLQVAEIASRQGIPERYLEQMMTSLRRGGLLRSLRGPRGGYQLTRPPEAVTLAQVIHCLEGDPAVSPDEPARSPEFQVIDALAGELARTRLAHLESTTLANLLEQRDQRLQAQAMYFI